MFKDSLRSTIRIARIELNTMFFSPVAWLILVIFTFQVGFKYSGIIDEFIFQIMKGYQVGTISDRIFAGPYGLFTAINEYLYLYFPILTMGILSKEYNSGSIKLLYSSPISNTSIVVGKFLSMVVYSLSLMCVVFITVGFTALVIPNFEYQPVLTGSLGVFLLMLIYSAIGIFMSSLTSYQVVAAVGTLALLAFLNFVGDIGQDIDFVRNITYWLSLMGRNESFIGGLLPSEDLIYFIVVIIFFLVLTVLRLRQKRDKVSKQVVVLRYAGAVTVTLLLGYITSMPTMKLYYDATYNKRNTLSVESQEVMDKLKEKMTITTYVNILDSEYYTGLPRNYNYDQERFERYMRFNPRITLKYVYYYHKSPATDLTKRYPGKTDEEIAKIICKTNNLDFDRLLNPQEIDELIDLSGEAYQFVRIVDLEDGKKVVLRLFNDQQRHPGETEISGAFKQLVEPSIKVGFTVGHGERDINNYGEQGFYFFSKDKRFRESIINHGFVPYELDIENNDIPEDIKVLVISGLKEDLSDAALERVNDYLEKGGNAFILGDYLRQDNMNKLTESLGVKFSDGYVANQTNYFSPSIVINEIIENKDQTFPSYNSLKYWEYDIIMPTTLAIDYSAAEEKFEVLPILRTQSADAWIEYETTDFIDGVFEINPEAGEKAAYYTTMVALRRDVNGKQQRIMVAGDSDFIANAELTANRSGVYAGNYGIITGAFRWFSYEEFPIRTARISRIDVGLNLGKDERKPVRNLFIAYLPGLLILLGIFTIFRRQRK